MLTKSNPCYITVSATLVLLGVELTMPRPRLFSVLIFSTKHISLRREQSSKHYCLGSKRPAKDNRHEFTYTMSRPQEFGCVYSVQYCDVLFYVSLKKKHTAKFSLLTPFSYFNQLVLQSYLLFTPTLLTLSLILSPHPTPTLSQI